MFVGLLSAMEWPLIEHNASKLHVKSTIEICQLKKEHLQHFFAISFIDFQYYYPGHNAKDDDTVFLFSFSTFFFLYFLFIILFMPSFTWHIIIGKHSSLYIRKFITFYYIIFAFAK